MRSLKKEDIDNLQRQIPSRDVVAERQMIGVTHGVNVSRIEEIENRMLPWLRDRRRKRER